MIREGRGFLFALSLTPLLATRPNLNYVPLVARVGEGKKERKQLLEDGITDTFVSDKLPTFGHTVVAT